jgi:hypothetical protein
MTMANGNHRVFISYHHANDQAYKKALLDLNAIYDIFIDMSVDTGDIDDRLDDNAIRQKIRDEYLMDSSVTVVLVGLETKGRKHIDWEIYSSMYNGSVNKQSGILIINLPSTNCTHYTAAHGDTEKKLIYPDSEWTSLKYRSEYEGRYPHMPDRIIDNLLNKDAKISVTYWEKILGNVEALRFLIDTTFNDRESCEYDLSRPMRRANA